MRRSLAALNTKTVVAADGKAYDRTDLPADLQKILNRYWVYEYDNIVRDQDGYR